MIFDHRVLSGGFAIVFTLCLPSLTASAASPSPRVSAVDIEKSLIGLFESRAQSGLTGSKRSDVARIRPLMAEDQRARELSMEEEIRSFMTASNSIHPFESEDIAARSSVKDIVVRERTGARVVVSSYEVTTYDWRHKGSSDVATSGFGINHTTVIEKSADGIVVVRDEIHEPHGMMRDADSARYITPNPYAETTSPESGLESGEFEEGVDPPSPGAAKPGDTHFPDDRGGSEKVHPSISVNKNATIGYARKHALEYNKSYVRFDQDCTNFVSQAFRAGGWDFMRPDKEMGKKSWWYSSRKRKWSKTWVEANNFYRWLDRSGRASGLAGPRDLRPGDIMQVGTKGSFNVFHSTVVTSMHDGEPTLTYHTSNTLDKPWRRFFEASGGDRAAYYSWRIA